MAPDPAEIDPPWTTPTPAPLHLTVLPEPAGIDAVLTKPQWLALALHLHNGNSPFDFVMGWVGGDGVPIFARSKHQHFDAATDSCWNSILPSDRTPFAVATYCANPDGHSRWACFDIDAHSPADGIRAEWQMKHIMQVIERRSGGMAKEDVSMLLEHSGRGFHIFLIRASYWPIQKWHSLLNSILNEAFADIEDHLRSSVGIDLFPPRPARPGGFGKAVRLPGSANPSTWKPTHGTYQVSQVLAHFNLDRLLVHLGDEYYQRGSSFGITEKPAEGLAEMLAESPVEAEPGKGWPKAKPAEVKPVHTLKEAQRLLQAHPITQPATRHNQLVRLVSEGFYNFGKKALRTLAIRQFLTAQCPPSSTLECHIQEFEAAYAWSIAGYCERLSKEESRVFSNLRPALLREAFIIAQNFARFGKTTFCRGKDGRFPLSGIELGSRLVASQPYGDQLRRKLVNAGCMRCVEAGGFPNRANMYVWTLPLRDHAESDTPRPHT